MDAVLGVKKYLLFEQGEEYAEWLLKIKCSENFLVETHLRLILFLVGVIILTLVVLDVLRQRNLKKQQNELIDEDQSEPRIEYERRQQILNFGEEFNDENWNNSREVEQPEIFQSTYVAQDHDKSYTKKQPLVVNNEINNEPLITNTAPIKNDKARNDIFALFVIARESKGFEGDKLKRILETANLIYGKMNIFHKFDDNNQDSVSFSVASAVEPGAFDLKRLNVQFIPGVTIFMMPAMVRDPKKAFDALVRTAKQLAFSLNGELRDQYRNPLTLQIIDKYKRNIEFYTKEVWGGAPTSPQI